MTENNRQKNKPFAHCANLDDITLIKSNFECFTQERPKGGTLEVGINTGYNTSEKDGLYIFTARFDVSISGKEPEEEKSVFNVDISFIATYSLKQCCSTWVDEEKNAFLEQSAMMHVWPYVREHIDKLTAGSSVPRVVLPLFPIGGVGKGEGE